MNIAFARRKTVEAMEARKLAMIGGLYANSNLDDGKGTRAKIVGELEEQFKEAIAELYDPTPDVPLKGNPFFDAMKVPGADLTDEQIAEFKRQNPEVAQHLAQGVSEPPIQWDIDQDEE